MTLLLQWTVLQLLFQKNVTVTDIPYIKQLLGSGRFGAIRKFAPMGIECTYGQLHLYIQRITWYLNSYILEFDHPAA